MSGRDGDSEAAGNAAGETRDLESRLRDALSGAPRGPSGPETTRTAAEDLELGRLALEAGLITAQQLSEALAQQSTGDTASLKVLELRKRIPARLLVAFPGIDGRLAKGDEEAWTAAFLEALGSGPEPELLPTLEVSDLDYLAPRAFRGAADVPTIERLLRAAGRYSLNAAAPEILALLDPEKDFYTQARLATLALAPRLAAPELVARIVRASATEAEAATETLVELGTPEAEVLLLPLLGSKRGEVRENAARSLGTCGTARCVGALVALLKDPEPRVRLLAAEALGTLGGREAAPALADLVEGAGGDDPGAVQVACGAAEALAKLGGRRYAGVVLRGFFQLKAPERHRDSQLQLAQALGNLGATEVVPALKRLLAMKEYSSKAKLLPVLVKLGARDAGPEIAACLEDASDEVRREAVTAARSLELREAVPLLLRLLGDSDAEVRERARIALVSLEPDRARSGALEVLLNPDAPPRARAEAAVLAGSIGGTREVSALHALLKEAKMAPDIQLAVMHALADLGATPALPEMRRILASDDAVLAAASAIALGRSADREAIPQLLGRLRDSRSPGGVRVEAARALAAMGASEAVPALRQMLDEADLGWAAAGGLARLGEHDILPGLLKLLDRPADWEFCRVVEALGDLDRPAVVRRLKEKLRSSARRDRTAAAVGLCRLAEREGVPTLLREASTDAEVPLNALNALRRPMAWQSLRTRRKAAWRPEGSVLLCPWLEVLTGLKVEDLRHQTTSVFWNSPGEESWDSPLEVLDQFVRSFILDGELRILPHDRALRFWQEWWAAGGEAK